jgi:NADH:ubiquinone oxidoreductase subunit E
MERRDLLLSSLHQAQAESGTRSIDDAALDNFGKRFNLSKAELRGVASYYSMYSLERRGRHLVKVCDSPVCRMLGSRKLLEDLGAALGVEPGGTDASGTFTLETCQCLGRCADAPVMTVDDLAFHSPDAASIPSLLETLRAEDGPPGARSDGGGPRGD